MKPAKAEMLMMASIQSMTSPQRKAPVCGAGACSGTQFVLVDFVPKKGKPVWASGVFKVDVERRGVLASCAKYQAASACGSSNVFAFARHSAANA
jgi:hypothetical protein